MKLAYFAHPMTSYNSARITRALDRVRSALSGWVVIDPEAAAWRDNAEWLAEWPRIVQSIDALVLVPDDEGCVGAGCLSEVANAIALGVPVAAWNDRCGLCELSGVTFRYPLTPQRSAVVVIGDPLPAGRPDAMDVGSERSCSECSVVGTHGPGWTALNNLEDDPDEQWYLCPECSWRQCDICDETKRYNDKWVLHADRTCGEILDYCPECYQEAEKYSRGWVP